MGKESGPPVGSNCVCKEVAVEVWACSFCFTHTHEVWATCFALPGTLVSQDHGSASSCGDLEASCSCRKLRVP